VQLHEFETVLFVQPEKIDTFFPGSARPTAALQAIANAHASPEQFDDGPTTAPSKRFIAQIPADAGAKATAGPQIAAAIGLEAIREKRPHFAARLARLENLGGAVP
jgi:hypothetical protein